MTDIRPCIRGCTRRCTADHCLTTGEHDHDPIPRPAKVGHLCQQCADRLLEAIDDIPDLYAQLPPLDQMQRSGGEKVARGKVTGSPALVRLDVMVLQGYGYEGDGVMPVLHTLGGWAQLIAEEVTPSIGQQDTITEWCQTMRTWHDSICRQPWVDEYWSDLIQIRAALRRATDAPPAVGRCFGRVANKPCGRLLYPTPGGGEIVCPDVHCGRRYSGADLLKLQIQGEREGIAS